MKAVLLAGMCILAPAGAILAAAEEPLLFDTWAHSYFHQERLDEFVQAHKAQYTDDYFQCSEEAQRLISEEANVRDRRCDFSPGAGVRSRCRSNNHFRGVDKHLAELDKAIRTHTAWLDLESGRNAATGAQAAADLQRSCEPSDCAIAERKKSELLRDLKPYLQCPPLAERPSEMDPSFKTFELPRDSGG